MFGSNNQNGCVTKLSAEEKSNMPTEQWNKAANDEEWNKLSKEEQDKIIVANRIRRKCEQDYWAVVEREIDRFLDDEM